MCEDENRFWGMQPDSTEGVMLYADKFVSWFTTSDEALDYSEQSLLKNIQFEIDNTERWLLDEHEYRLFWAQALAYVSATLCKLFSGHCVGAFNYSNAELSRYSFRVCINGQYYNVEEALCRARSGEHSLEQWLSELKLTSNAQQAPSAIG